ncbi:putative Histidine kinase [Rubrivivax sp. A210]|uniref:sensor histidine kinase n=1 Tax=Rubrivivax sp. A210 TaxID=2772301 RepID=UPI00191A0B04|nr:HAMP domain-containing sensor histidine kinase [Rubrivivax sp. A210]CAD5366360.1 putative Histidine kinase [Rubrivivax sp. A210]
MAARWSLRGRLLGIAATCCALSWLAGGAAIYVVVEREDALLFDERLKDVAQTVLVFADHELMEIAALGGSIPAYIDTDATAGGRYWYRIWSGEGRLILSSHNVPAGATAAPANASGLATLALDGQAYRIATVVGPTQKFSIQAGEPISRRRLLADVFSGYLLYGVLLSAAALALMSLLLTRLALRPLQCTTDEIASRGPGDLRPVPRGREPLELAPVLQAVNQLMHRVDVALRSERQFVSAAAHELRTPLSGMRAQAQLAAHPRTSTGDRNQALQAVQDSVDHAAHLVSQLLDLARSDALAGDPVRLASERETVELRTLVEAVMGELGPQAAERGVRIELRLALDRLSGSAFGLQLILRNLLANAVAHAAGEGPVFVGTRLTDDGHAVLWVADNGPGIPAAERARCFERFHRGKGNATPGCGLGLSIVKALADAHDAEVRLGQADSGGLLAEVVFPPR